MITGVIALGAAAAVFAGPRAGASQAANPTDLPPASVALVTTYVDGRATYDFVTARLAWFWTPDFPRMPSSALPGGALPVTALKITRQLIGRDVRATVALLRGSAHEQEDVVAIVMVSPGAHVLINELRPFGVQPVDLSLAAAAPISPSLPSVLSVTPEFEISAVDTLTAPYPGYRITVRNLSSSRIANFHVQSYRGLTKALSSVPRGSGGRPAMEPGGSFVFDLNLTGGGMRDGGPGYLSPAPLDVIEVDSVLWDDGTIVGDMMYADARRAIAGDAGRRVTLMRAVEILRAAQSETGAPRGILTRPERASGAPNDRRCTPCRCAGEHPGYESDGARGLASVRAGAFRSRRGRRRATVDARHNRALSALDRSTFSLRRGEGGAI